MKLKNVLCLMLAFLLLFSFAGCGSGKADNDMMNDPSDGNYAYSKDDVLYEVEYEKPAPSENYGGGMGLDKVEESGQFEEKLIYTVSMQAQTKDFDAALASIREMVKALGGYEESVNTTGAGYGSESYYTRRATLKVRIPSGGLDGFLGSVKQRVNVTSENISMSNATEEYYDLEARVAVLREEQAAYEKMMGEAKDTDSLLKIKDRLYNVIAEIESARSRMNVINSRADYSTVTIGLDEVKEFKPITTPKTGFGERIVEAFRESWLDFAEGFENFTVWFVGAIPTLLVLLVIGGSAVTLLIVVKKRKRARAEKKEER